jgi:hypothetical protein
MVFGQLLGNVISHPVDAAIAHLCQHEETPDLHHGTDCRAHAGLAQIELCHRIHDVSGRLNGPFEQPMRSLKRSFAGRIIQREFLLASLDHAENCVARLLAGNFSSRVSTHAICDDP